MKRDIVYLLKSDVTADEIRYSLRTVCRFFPFRHIVFVGGCPDGIVPDLYIPDDQPGATKWARSTHSLKLALNSPDISDEFFLFNDDFFILKPVDNDSFVNFVEGTLEHKVKNLINAHGDRSTYAERMSAQRSFLRVRNRDTLNFGVHMPFLVNKAKARKLFEKFPNLQMFRSTYANYYRLPYAYHADVKITDLEMVPGDDWDYLSTSDESFRSGAIGAWIRDRETRPCIYEKSGASLAALSREAREETRELYTEDGDEIYLS